MEIDRALHTGSDKGLEVARDRGLKRGSEGGLGTLALSPSRRPWEALAWGPKALWGAMLMPLSCRPTSISAAATGGQQGGVRG